MRVFRAVVLSVLVFGAIAGGIYRLRQQKQAGMLSEWAPQRNAEPTTSGVALQSTGEASACYRAYRNFYANPEVHIHVAFGYKDARPARYVGDRYERLMLVQELLRPCHTGNKLCGFERLPDDGDLFVKRIFGPDGKRRSVFLRVTSSSVSPDDDENRKDPYQTWQSESAARHFLESLSAADAVLYNGHSRDGGGPDFFPPRLTRSKQVDYQWYSRTKPGVKLMSQGLAEGPKRIKLFGLFSCVSDKHFGRELKSAPNKFGVITQKQLVYYADALKQVAGTLAALIGMWCESDFASAIQAEAKGGDTKLELFFPD